MVKQNLYFLYSGIYQTHCAFSNINSFIEKVKPFLNKADANLNDTLHSIDNAIDEFSNPKSSIQSEKDALRFLIAEDLRRISLSLKNSRTDLIFLDINTLNKDLDYYISEIANLGVNIKKPYFNVVEKFPAPFDKFKWSAFCPDAEDEKRYNIPQGIYFRQDSLRPYYSQVLLAHELIHTIAGKHDPNLLAMGLEEGLAEILGSLYLGSQRVGTDLAINIFHYGRHSFPINPIWKLYLDHARQAVILYHRFGLKGLVTLLIRGRKTIHDIEGLILRGDFQSINLPQGIKHPQIDDLINYILLGYLPNYIISPLSRYLASFIEEGRTIKEICEEALVPFDLGKRIMEKMSSETTLFIIDDDMIQYSNLNFYISLEKNHNIFILRYNIET